MKKGLLIYSILSQRIKAINLIHFKVKNSKYRAQIFKLISKLEEQFIINSSINNCNTLYFNINYTNGLSDNLFFEYNDILKRFIYFVSIKENYLCNKILQGNFIADTSNYSPVVDSTYPTTIVNDQVYNIINVPKILNKIKEQKEYLEEDITTFLIQNKKRNKQINYKKSKSQGSFTILPRSLSKSILKPSKSYLTLKEKKIKFGSTEFLN